MRNRTKVTIGRISSTQDEGEEAHLQHEKSVVEIEVRRLLELAGKTRPKQVMIHSRAATPQKLSAWRSRATTPASPRRTSELQQPRPRANTEGAETDRKIEDVKRGEKGRDHGGSILFGQAWSEALREERRIKALTRAAKERLVDAAQKA